MMRFTVLSQPADVEEYVEIVRAKADTDKDALGFLPERVYGEAAELGRLFVAVTSVSQPRYAGHLLFGGVFPAGRIFQIFIDPAFRGSGIGKMLITKLVGLMEAGNYLSLSAKVASDLKEANHFWEKMGFVTVRTKPGGATRGRLINIRSRDLETPSLLSLMRQTPAGEMASLRLTERYAKLSPLYLIDLNVLFDVIKKRVRSEEAGIVFRAGLQNLVQIAISEEFIDELKRNSNPTQVDPVLQLSLTMPRLPHPSEKQIKLLQQELGTIIFPERTRSNKLTEQDKSDLRHLVTAIHHQASGFITSEKAILRARSALLTNYAIDVIGVGEFAARTALQPPQAQSEPLAAQCSNTSIRIIDLKPNETERVQQFLESTFVPPDQIRNAMHPQSLGRSKCWTAVEADGNFIALGCWEVTPGPGRRTDMLLAADEDHPASEAALDYLIDRIVKDSSRGGTVLIQMDEPPGHSKARKVAISHGFRAPEGQRSSVNSLQKLSLGKIVTPGNWDDVRHQLRTHAGVELPVSPPIYKDPDHPYRMKCPAGYEMDIPLMELEALLSPSLFLMPGRKGVVTPIKRGYAEDLLGTSDQFSLLASPEAKMLKERAYFSSPQTARLFQRGTPVIFYESGRDGKGRKAAIAIARVTSSTISLKSEVPQGHSRRGVLSPDMLNELGRSEQTVTTIIDNIMPFQKPIPFARLLELGCADRAGLVTSRSINADQLLAAAKEGFPDA